MSEYQNSVAYGLLKKFEAYRHEVEQYAAVANFCPIPVFLTSHDGLSVLYVNPAYIQMTGCDVASLSNGGWTKVIHPHDRERSFAVWQRFVETREPICIEERFVNTLTGDVFETICTVHAIPGNGMVGYIFPKGWQPTISRELLSCIVR